MEILFPVFPPQGYGSKEKDKNITGNQGNTRLPHARKFAKPEPGNHSGNPSPPADPATERQTEARARSP
ncbi:hypothetical protein E2C01_073305 [Portunus trituberculatus]|uniref:Uncharacterized protein n=1 Tax=Portunus trituberculatus TaxID=210409 RepID=A0A5B7IBD0_PORTR|nr:hypothetical protein [Portunus trituberculatus]